MCPSRSGPARLHPKGHLHPSQSRICLFWGVSSASPTLTLQSNILISDGRARRGAKTTGDVAWPREVLQDQQLHEPPGLLPLLSTSHGILERFDLEGWAGMDLKGQISSLEGLSMVESPWSDVRDVQKSPLGTGVEEWLNLTI